jgi:predicted NAD/FAD-binding protein
MPNGERTAAVIGSGIAGLTAAHILNRTHAVTLFESADRPGGHVHTHTVVDSAGGKHQIDSGFIVHNDQTYPLLRRLFSELGVRTKPAEMSMSISCGGCGLEYSGGRGVGGILAQPNRVFDQRFGRMLREVPRFHRLAKAVLAGQPDDSSWAGFLEKHQFSEYFTHHFAIPLVAGVWSCGYENARHYPAAYLFRFLDQHGMLSVRGSHTWRTVVGGARTYVEAILANLNAVHVATPVRAIQRHEDSVDIRIDNDSLVRFDRVVVATHADAARTILADATETEHRLLGEFSYSMNSVWLHRDSSVLPGASRARASWNYRMKSCREPSDRVLVSYWMNRLHDLTSDEQYLVTLNPEGWVDVSTALARTSYSHPILTSSTFRAAERLRSAGGQRLAFAGAHLGWGFHEDGCRSGVHAAERFGVVW